MLIIDIYEIIAPILCGVSLFHWGCVWYSSMLVLSLGSLWSASVVSEGRVRVSHLCEELHPFFGIAFFEESVPSHAHCEMYIHGRAMTGLGYLKSDGVWSRSSPSAVIWVLPNERPGGSIM